ncbi:putative ABC-type xenobiotic transporter [Dioscorea sansibarensis]
MLLEFVQSSVFTVLVIWALIDYLNFRREHEAHNHLLLFTSQRLDIVTLLCNILISVLHLCSCVYQVFMVNKTSFLLSLLLPALSWLFAALFAFYCKIRSRSCSRHRKWPLVLVSWWIFSLFTDPVSIYKTRTNVVLGVVIFTLTAYLCFIAIFMNSGEPLRELRQPLLVGGDKDVFGDAGFLSRLLFRWLNTVFEIGRRRRLELHHIPPVPEDETAEKSYSFLQDSLFMQMTEVSSLPRAIIHSVWKPLAINALFAGINILCSYIGPFLITTFVEFLSGFNQSKWGGSYGYMLAFLFFFGKTVESLSQRQWYFGARQIGIRARAALMVAIYNRSLTLKYSSLSNGKVMNFLNVDVERIGDFFWYFHSIWLLPFQVSLALIILYQNLGAAASFSAFIATVLIMISNTPLANSQERLHSMIMEAKDSRIKTTAETLKCMRILKLHAWENAYLNKILKLRDLERKWLKRYLYTCSAIAFLFWTSPMLVSVVTFGVCILVKMPLTPGSVLSALATFRILQEPIYNLPELVSVITQTKVSFDRIQDYVTEEQQKNSRSNFSKRGSNIAIEIEPGEYAWEADSNTKKPTLKIDRKLTIMRGQTVAVCGSVGSGKSSLLCSIIGEIPKIGGAGINVFGSTAYLPQSAWIQTGTVRDNVLFGKHMERRLYDEVTQGCALDRDISLWIDGDMTLIGERGINLSGGQKQRIQLARAIYSDSDVYLLDDPFSAVDAHTGAHLFKECLTQLLACKTVFFVTHQLEFLPAADLVLVMRDGKIVQSGKYKELIADTDGELMQHMGAHKQSLNQVTPSSKKHSPLLSTKQKIEQSDQQDVQSSSHIRNSDCSEKTNEEERESGRVKWHVYRTFVTSAYKGALIPLVLLCQIIFQGLQICSNYWIAWASEKGDRVSKEKLIGVFIMLSIGSSLFVLGRAVLLATIALETAQKLFLGMMKSVFCAPIFFFDTTPSSRILNRSSTDQSTVDTDIPYRLAGLVFALVQLLCIIVIMSSVAWPVIVVFIIVLAISYWYQNYYTSTARELARMVGIRKAPILHHLSESISGAATIRCFNQEDRFITRNLSLIDDYSRVTFYNFATMEWLSVRINFLFNLVLFFILIILVTLPKNAIDPSLAGLAATYGLNLNVLQGWVIWNLCNVENKMISVERILQFSDIPSEAPTVIDDCRPEEDWPTCGTIEFDDLHVSYNPGFPKVLKGISCIFPGQKKIGVVGRTGSGKSTLIQALFRMVEPSEGKILIDGINISKIGLHDLRSRLSIIPQDPTLFQGTVRTNLDPLQQHSDSELWEALRKCHLWEIVKQDRRLLDAPVAEDGENWSVGQRQLVCLARVLLQKRRVLVLDEATASIDTATDNLIQKTIREETGNCTIITVAHRIPTVIDSDLVLVLDEGRVLEFDSPNNLLRDASSAFSKLVIEYLGRNQRDNGFEFT